MKRIAQNTVKSGGKREMEEGERERETHTMGAEDKTHRRLRAERGLTAASRTRGRRPWNLMSHRNVPKRTHVPAMMPARAGRRGRRVVHRERVNKKGAEGSFPNRRKKNTSQKNEHLPRTGSPPPGRKKKHSGLLTHRYPHPQSLWWCRR